MRVNSEELRLQPPTYTDISPLNVGLLGTFLSLGKLLNLITRYNGIKWMNISLFLFLDRYVEDSTRDQPLEDC